MAERSWIPKAAPLAVPVDEAKAVVVPFRPAPPVQLVELPLVHEAAAAPEPLPKPSKLLVVPPLPEPWVILVTANT